MGVTPKIAPSMLSSDFANLASEAKRMLDFEADWLHMDIMVKVSNFAFYGFLSREQEFQNSNSLLVSGFCFAEWVCFIALIKFSPLGFWFFIFLLLNFLFCYFCD